ncbi:MAG TPA: FlgD immunoglobulin-like domain containing protein [Vicinamibacterales bacterium]|nr:FlgD immunoglobulin-like domain containing protein [Vicinamibacterales bacterium]
MKHSLSIVLPAAVLAVAVGFTLEPAAAPAPQTSTAPTSIDPTILKAYQWRSIGPARAGRSIASSGVKGRPKEAYTGQTGGGLWKTVDGGQTWISVTDGQIHSSSVGAVAVSESNPDIVFIGTGESCIRGNIQPGDGVYKSTDAGKTWTHIGFKDSDAISKIRIHPTNPDIVFVADFGRYGMASDERGVFKSTDGGKTWRKVLFRDNKTGAVDIAIDRNNPDVMFASLWEAYRVEYSMSSGGPGSGLFKSTDGGEHWTEISRNAGLPKGILGKIGVAVSGAESNRVYAVVENENGGLFSSDDAGASWKLINAGRNLRQRAFYYTHVAADPKNRDTVWVLNVGTFWSRDGGKTMVSYAGGDSHDFWIDPDDNNHIVHSNDSGTAVSFNAQAAQRTWSARDYPTGQYYHAISTAHVPYHVCGAQQDSSTVCVPSNTNLGGGRGFGGGGGRGGTPELYSPGGSEDGYVAPDPKNPDIFYAGGNNGSFLTRLDRRTNNTREVNPYPRAFSGEASNEVVERWQWTYPIIFSQADPTVLYTASQHVWRTTNGGEKWDRISGDLTRHDPKTMGPSGGPITHDMNSPEIYATVFALGPGKKDVNILWAGSDDGLIQVTRDGGKTWTNVTPKDMPDLGRVSIIDASSLDPGAAYAAVKKPLLDDFAPYIFRTHDFGNTWTKIVAGIPATDYVHSVREDPMRRGLLYAGTQHGFYVSYDDGDRWQPLSLNLPDVQVSDIWVEANSIAIATHGRGFYILDDIAPLRQTGAAAESGFVLYKPADAVRSAGPASIDYLLAKPAEKLTLEILDSNGALVETIQGGAQAAGGTGRGGRGAQGARGAPGAAAPEAQAAEDQGFGGGRGRGGPPTASMTAGLNRVAWNLDYPGPVTFPGMILWGATTNGPMALPGTYQVRLTVDGQSQTQPLVIRKHPLRDTPDADLQEQFTLGLQIRDKVSQANNAVIEIRRIKAEVNDRMTKTTKKEFKLVADRLVTALSAVEQDLYQVKNQSGQDPLNFPIKTNNRLASLLGMTLRGEGKPTANIYPIFEDLKKELKAEADRLNQVLSTELKSFNIEATNAGLPPVSAAGGS